MTRVHTERVRELLAAATPGPWTCEPVGYGQHAVIPDARHEIFVEVAGDAALIAAAPDLAAQALSLADALATAERERDAARASADRSAQAAVDAARELGHAAAQAVADRDAARQAHAELAAAVRAYLDAVDDSDDSGDSGDPYAVDARADLEAALARCP